MNALAIRLFAYALLASLLVFGGCRWQARMDAGALAEAKAESANLIAAAQVEALAASEKAREAEQAKALAVNAAAAEYERGKQDAQALADHTADSLRAGNVRLRGEIAALAARGLSCPASATGELEAAAERGASLVGAAVGIGRECDARVSALINAYEASK